MCSLYVCFVNGVCVVCMLWFVLGACVVCDVLCGVFVM